MTRGVPRKLTLLFYSKVLSEKMRTHLFIHPIMLYYAFFLAPPFFAAG